LLLLRWGCRLNVGCCWRFFVTVGGWADGGLVAVGGLAIVGGWAAAGFGLL